MRYVKKVKKWKESNKQTWCNRTWRSFFFNLVRFVAFGRGGRKKGKFYLQKCNYNSWTKWRVKFIILVVHLKMWFHQLKQIFLQRKKTHKNVYGKTNFVFLFFSLPLSSLNVFEFFLTLLRKGKMSRKETFISENY